MSKEFHKYLYNNQEIELGDVMIIPVEITSEEVIVDLIQQGYPIEKVVYKSNRLEDKIEERLASISNNLEKYLDFSHKQSVLYDSKDFFSTFFPLELYNMYSKNIAVELDRSYKDNIRNCTELYVINDINGKPLLIHKENFTKEEWCNIINNTAVFRTEVDLIVCQILLKDLKKKIWKGKPRRNINNE